MTAVITAYQPGDTHQLVKVWNEANRADPITVQRFRDLVLMDVNFDAAGLRVAREGNDVIGAAYAVRRTTASVGSDLEAGSGWIPFFFVGPSAQRKGLGRALLKEAMSWLAGHGVREVFFSSYTPNYILPGLDEAAYPAARGLLSSLGFTQRYVAAAMDRLLTDYTYPAEMRAKTDDLLARGYEVGEATTDDLAELVVLARDHFNPDWARAIREAVVQGMPVDNIAIARDPAGTLVGWAMHGTYEGVTDRFGPFGVREDQRGTGLGKILLHRSLNHMKARGSHSAWFLWTGETSPAGHLYLSTGFVITRRFTVMSAPVATGQ